jgi:hypothetical protein
MWSEAWKLGEELDWVIDWKNLVFCDFWVGVSVICGFSSDFELIYVNIGHFEFNGSFLKFRGTRSKQGEHHLKNYHEIPAYFQHVIHSSKKAHANPHQSNPNPKRNKNCSQKPKKQFPK